MRVSGYDVRHHEVGDRAPLPDGRSMATAEIAIGEDTDDLMPVHDDEVPDSPQPHLGPGALG